MKWQLKTFLIKDLIPYHKNPRKLTKEQFSNLSKSIEKFGLIDKPIVTKEGIVVGGHQRLEVLRKMKIKEIECYVPESDLSEKDIEELNIRLNQGGEFDFEILANQYNTEDLINWGFELKDFEIDFPEGRDQEEKCKCPTCGKSMKKGKNNA